MQPVSRFADCAGLRLHYRQWGADDGQPVICWHGVTETGQMFAPLARALAGAGYRSICPDLPGRGQSQWADDPVEQYRLPFYAGLQEVLLDALRLQHVRIVATSVGGHHSILAAGGALRKRVSHLVLNDVGTFLPEVLAPRLIDFLSSPPVFAGMAEAEAWWRRCFVQGGAIAEADWPDYLETLLRRDGEGRLTVHFDPRISCQLSFWPAENHQPAWADYDRIEAPVLLFRAGRSPILSPETAAAMARRGPKAKLITVPDCGHAPALNTQSEIAAVLDFLQTNNPCT